MGSQAVGVDFGDAARDCSGGDLDEGRRRTEIWAVCERVDAEERISSM